MTRKTITILSASLFLLLLAWGTYTFIVYTGIPAHGQVYLTQEQSQAVFDACGANASKATYWCRGWETLPYFIRAIFVTARPFFAYVVLSLLAYASFLAVSAYRTGRFTIEASLRPVHVLVAFVLSVWLLGTTFSLGSLDRAGENPFRRFYEPRADVYSERIGPEALAALQDNYRDLLDRGCLKEIGTAQSGVVVYDMRFRCMQQSLIARAGGQIVLLVILALNLLVAGSLILRLTRTTFAEPLQSLLSLGLGSFAWLSVLWLLAVLGLFRTGVLAPLFFAFPLLAFPVTRAQIKRFLVPFSSGRSVLSHLSIILGWLLISYLALNFLNVVRPFPIGWDDLGSYLNRPRLLASYGSFIPSMSFIQWEYLSAMAYTLFGLDSAIGATFAMQTNWLAGALSVFTLFVFGRMFLGARAGFLAAIFFYFLPMTGHFSFADMKIDNASFFLSAASLVAIFVWAFGMPAIEKEPPRGRTSVALLFFTGIIAGLAFSVKPTAVLTIFFLLSVLAGSLFGGFGFAALSAASFAVLGKFAPFNLPSIVEKIGVSLNVSGETLQTLGLILFVLAALALFIHALRSRLHALRPFLSSLLVLGGGMLIAVLPWMVHNLTSHHALPSLQTALLSYNDTDIQPYVTYVQEEDLPEERRDSDAPVHFLPPELALDPEHPQCTISSRREELDRYWGYRTGWSHYLTLPWRAVMNIDHVGYYVTLMPALLLLPLLLLLPFFWKKESRWLRFLFTGSMVFFVQWTFVANGIIWYGIGMFFGFSVLLEVLALRAPDKPNRILTAILLGLSIAVMLVNRMWQFDVQRNLFEYPLGKATEETIREVTVPYYNDIRDSVLERHASMPDRPYTYRMGTFIAFFIPRNIEIMPLADHQVSFFNCLNQERDHALTLRRLQALGFNSLIFDTNTATIEKDPEGTLHQKVNALMNFLNDPTLGLDIVINDPGGGIVYVLLP